jgi:hypothetical protein
MSLPKWPYNDIYMYLNTPPIATLKPVATDDYNKGVIDHCNNSVTWNLLEGAFAPEVKTDSNGLNYFNLNSGFGLVNNSKISSGKYTVLVLGNFNKFTGPVSDERAFFTNPSNGQGLSIIGVDRFGSFTENIVSSKMPVQQDFMNAGVSVSQEQLSGINMYYACADTINGIYTGYSNINIMGIANQPNGLSSVKAIVNDLGKINLPNKPFNFNQVGLPNSPLQDGMTGSLYSLLLFDRVLSMVEINTLYQFYKTYYGMQNIMVNSNSSQNASTTFSPILL